MAFSHANSQYQMIWTFARTVSEYQVLKSPTDPKLDTVMWNGSDSNQDLSIHCHSVWFLIPLLFRLCHLDFELASWKTINGNVGGIFTEPDYVWGSSCRAQEKFFALQSILTPKDTGQIICIFSLREFSCVKKYFRDLVNRVFSPSIGAILAISFTS